MRPLLDLRFFADLPKFIWFDNGDGGDGSSGSGGDASGGDAGSPGSASAGPSGQGGTATGAPAGMGVSGEAAAPAGTSATAPGTGPGTGTATADAGFGGQGGSPGGVSGGVAASVGAGPGVAASGGAAPGGAGGTAGSSTSGGGTGGPGSTGSATGGGGTGGPGAATGGGGGTASGGSGTGVSPSVVQALRGLLGGNPADALRGAVRNAEIGFGPPGVPSLGVPEGVGGQGAAPRGTVSVSSLGPPGPNLAQLAQQLFGSPQAQAARSSISADTGDEFGPTNTTKGTGSSTATAANTGKAPGVGGAAVAGGTPSPADFGPARGAMGNVSTASLAGPAIALGGGPGNASESPTGTPAAPSLSIGPGGIGSDAVAGGSSPNAPPGTPTVANTPGPPGTDPTLGGKAPGYYGMTMGFPAVEGVSPGLTAAPAGPSPAAPTGDPGARGSSAVGTPATDNSPTGDPGLSPHQAAMVQDALDYARANFGPPQIEGQPPAFSNAPPEAFTMPNAEPLQPSPLQQLIQSLVSGGAPGPGLSSLAQNAQFGI